MLSKPNPSTRTKLSIDRSINNLFKNPLIKSLNHNSDNIIQSIQRSNISNISNIFNQQISIFIYGSTKQKLITPYSDIDLIIISDDKFRLNDKIRLMEHLKPFGNISLKFLHISNIKYYINSLRFWLPIVNSKFIYGNKKTARVFWNSLINELNEIESKQIINLYANDLYNKIEDPLATNNIKRGKGGYLNYEFIRFIYLFNFLKKNKNIINCKKLLKNAKNYYFYLTIVKTLFYLRIGERIQSLAKDSFIFHLSNILEFKDYVYARSQMNKLTKQMIGFLES